MRRVLTSIAAIGAALFTTSGFAATTVQVVEYYNAGQDHYFISSLPADIHALDTGVFKGWARTGRTFEAWPEPTGTASAVCRSSGSPPDTTTTTLSDTPSSAGITQIRFCGSAAH